MNPEASSPNVVEWKDVSTLDELWEGEMADVAINDYPVLLVRLPGDRVVAYQGVCPHQETLLIDGELENQVLTCFAHRWQFDLKDGHGINPANCRLFQYQVKVENGTIFIAVPDTGTKPYHRCAAESL